MATRDCLYAGPTKKLDRAALAKLGSSHVLQPKLDGIYGLVSTDRAGRISTIVTRAGEVLGPALLGEFRDVRWVPDSLVAAEVELWTESSNRAAAARGYRKIYPFDAHRIAGRNLTHDTYGARRDALMRAESALVAESDDRSWYDHAETGRAHDITTGDFVRRVPVGWRRVTVVPQMRACHADQAWSEWVDRGAVGPCEGLVAIDTTAPLGRGKWKCKLASTLDCVVVELDARAMVVYWTAGQRRVVVSRPRSREFTVGSVVELVHEGFYDDGGPRFARVARARPDLAM